MLGVTTLASSEVKIFLNIKKETVIQKKRQKGRKKGKGSYSLGT